MIMNFNSENTKFIIESYYKKFEGLDGNLSITSSIKKIGPIGRSLVPTEVSNVSFLLKGKMSIQGAEKEVDVPVSEEYIEKAFKFILDEEGFIVESVKINSSTENNAVLFKGVSVNVKSKKTKKDGVK